MAVTRKELLVVGAGAAALAACGDGSGRATDTRGSAAPPLRPGDWGSVKAQWALEADLHHFATFVIAPHALTVAAAIERHRRGLDADPAGYLHAQEGTGEDGAAAALATHLGVRSEHVALTRSTTEGLALLYRGLRLAPGDEVLTTRHDFYATHEALRLRGAPARRVRLYGDASRARANRIVAAIREALTPRTRVVAVTWVHSSTGVKLPVSEIAEAVRDHNRGRAAAARALLCVDGVHGLGAEVSDLEALGCDAFASGCHKWLAGPRGTGVLWAKPDAWRAIDPLVPSFDGAPYGAWLEGRTPPRDPAGPIHTPGGYLAFEHRWALPEALSIHATLGQEAIASRIQALATRLKEGLAGINGVDVVTPMDTSLSSGLVCFDVRDRDPGEVVDRLLKRHRVVASITPYAQRHVRMGTTLQVLEDDVDAAIAGVRDLARG